MAQSRKTRQQKIKKGQRSPHAEIVKTNPDIAAEPLGVSLSNDENLTDSQHQDLVETQLYVIEEVKRIGWISVVCFIIIAIATIFLSDFSWAQSIRDWLPF